MVKLKIDLTNGTIEVEADSDMFETAMLRAEAILDKFADIELAGPQPKGPTDENGSESDEAETPPSGKTKRTRRSGSSRTTTWKMVDKLLTESQRADLKKFYAEKNPTTQSEKVSVFCFKLKEVLGRDGFDGNEIHTAFQTVNEKTPGNLKAVFGNLAADGYGRMQDKKFISNFKADDLVKHDLPKAKK